MGYRTYFVMPDLIPEEHGIFDRHPVFLFLDSGVRRNDKTAASRGECTLSDPSCFKNPTLKGKE
jgi:hypothetical protein